MTFLEKILENKRREIADLKERFSLAEMRRRAEARNPVDFFGAIVRQGTLTLIAEIKRASPSRGVLRDPFSVEDLARAYREGGASALSVLTDETFFQGRLDHISIAKESAGLPILRKDFILDEIQVWESRLAGADAVLLIVAALSDEELKKLLNAAEDAGLMALVEVHDQEEMRRALRVGARLIGVNNRNLHDFTVDLQTTFKLRVECPRNVPLVAESGISRAQDIVRLKEAGVSAVLVGEGLLKEPNVEEATRKLLSGVNS